MRRGIAVLLAAITLTTSLGVLSALSPSRVSTATPANPASRLDYGPHRMLPDPDVYPRAPFAEPAGWTGTPPGTRSGGTRAAGMQDVIVLLIDFTDVAARASSADVDRRVNDAGPGAASVRNYYAEISYGQFGIQGTISPSGTWYHSSHTMTYYGGDTSQTQVDDANGPIYRLVVEAVRLADTAGVNFAPFDGDRDGIVDHVIVVHAGDAQESSGRSQDIWSHRWSVVDADPSTPGNQRLVADGVQIYGYIMVSETSPVGVFVHELGHDLGLPDLYDTDGSSDGIGVWDVMGSGSWNGLPRGTQPAHMSAWSKVQLGWVTSVVVTSPLLGQVIDQAETMTGASQVPQSFKLPVRTSPGGDEYFLVENRQRVGFDAALPGAGLLIWHVDDAVAGNQDDTHRLVDLKEADGNNKPTQAGDPWANSPAGFGPDTTPNSNSYLNQRTGWKVRNIGPSGAVMTGDLSREVDDDLVILAIRRPCCVPVGGTVSVAVTVGNRGAREQRNIAVNLTAYRGVYDAAAAVCCGGQTIASLVQGATANLSWDVPAAAAGKYILEVFVPLALDEIPENNVLFAHFNAAAYRLFDDVEAGVRGWTRNGASTDPAGWEIVQDGSETISHSPTHAWRFGPASGLPGPCLLGCPEFHTLTSPTIAVPGGPLYLYFWNRYDLRGRGIDNITQKQGTDIAYVNVSIGGLWRTFATFTDVHSGWGASFSNLTGYLSGPANVVVEFSASANVIQDGGGWWIDDIALANTPLLGGLVARPVTRQVTAEPGGLAIFRFKLGNVGDFDDNVTFALQPPRGWSALVGRNQTRMQPFDQFVARLQPDAEATLLLAFQVAADAQRGSRHDVPVTARSEGDVSIATTFDTVTIINDPFGLAGLEKYVVLFLIAFAAVIVIAVVIDAIKKQRGVYRRW